MLRQTNRRSSRVQTVKRWRQQLLQQAEGRALDGVPRQHSSSGPSRRLQRQQQLQQKAGAASR